jgi:hypothetical protein
VEGKRLGNRTYGTNNRKYSLSVLQWRSKPLYISFQFVFLFFFFLSYTNIFLPLFQHDEEMSEVRYAWRARRLSVFLEEEDMLEAEV